MKTVLFQGSQSIIHEPTGLLLQPGENIITSDQMADRVIADGTCQAGEAHVAADQPSEPVGERADPPTKSGKGKGHGAK